MSINNNTFAYALNQPLQFVPNAPIVAKRAPVSTDNYPIGQQWINESTNFYYVLTSYSNGVPQWQIITSGSGTIDTITTNSGVVTPSGGNVNITGGGSTNITTVGSGSTVTVEVISSPSFAGTVTAATGFVATTGNIVATVGNINATAGSMSAGTTITAGTGITATTGNIVASAGNISATSGSVSANTTVSAGTTITAGTGITATTGNITASSGNISASGTVSGQGLISSGDLIINYTSTGSTPYVATALDCYISVAITSAPITVQLPNAPAVGRIFTIKDTNGAAATHNITVTTVGGVVTIDGATTNVLSVNYESAQYIFNGTSYEVF